MAFKQAWLLALILCAPLPAAAAALGVSPTRLTFAPNERTAALTVTNTSTKPVMIQVRSLGWDDSASIGDLRPTTEMLAVPAVATLAPGQRQVVRVALRRPAPSPVERAYRLLISEVPPPETARTGGVVITVSFSLPVFVTVPGAEPDPRARIEQFPEGARLVVSNPGRAHLQVRGLRVRDPAGGDLVEGVAEGAYILPGKSAAWPLRRLRPGTDRLDVELDTAQGPFSLDAAR